MFFSARSHPLASIAKDLRLDILEMVNLNGGHIGGSLSCLDLLVSLYFSDLFDFKKDHFVLSAGHLAPALYAVLARKGYFPPSDLSTYSQFNSRLQGHVSTDVPGVEYSSGSLGQGLSFAAGLALGHPGRYSFCLTSDGEHQEGAIWEAAMFAAKYKLGNLINIIDCNGLQIDGTTDQIMPLSSLAQKYISFGWSVVSVDGHNFSQITRALKNITPSCGYPACLIARTTLGKGISFMENNCRYHDVKALPPDLYNKAKKEIENSATK